MLKGDLRLGRQLLRAGDGAEVSGVGELRIGWDPLTEALIVETFA